MRLISVGGLGNQLFIWGFAHHLLENGFQQVTIVDSWHRSHPERPFEIGQLKTSCTHNILTKSSRFTLRASQASSRIFSIDSRALKTILRFIGVEHESINREKSITWRKSTWLFVGYFQDYKLIGKVETTLGELTKFLKSLRALTLIDKKPYQAAHIRRGDYMELRETFGVLSNSYFLNQRKQEMNFIIIGENSKELQGLSENISEAILLDSNQANAWDVISVLSQADNAILSNSSLSWWGGLLGMFNGGSVTIPKPWFRSAIGVPQNLAFPGFVECESEWIN